MKFMKKLWLLPLTALLVSATALASNASFVQEEDLGKVAFDIGRIQTEWIPDGIWTEGEYTRIARKTSWLSAYVNDDADMDTALNLAFDLGLSWDAEYVYAFVRFTDPDGHVCPMDDRTPAGYDDHGGRGRRGDRRACHRCNRTLGRSLPRIHIPGL